MATRFGEGWISIARIIALIALLLEILVLVVPNAPEWLQAVVIILLAIAIIL